MMTQYWQKINEVGLSLTQATLVRKCFFLPHNHMRALCSNDVVYAAGIASESRFVSVLTLDDEGTPALELGGGLSSTETASGDAPTATAIACSPNTGVLAVAVQGKSVVLYELPSLSLQRTIAHTTLPVRALAFSHDDTLM